MGKQAPSWDDARCFCPPTIYHAVFHESASQTRRAMEPMPWVLALGFDQLAKARRNQDALQHYFPYHSRAHRRIL